MCLHEAKSTTDIAASFKEAVSQIVVVTSPTTQAHVTKGMKYLALIGIIIFFGIGTFILIALCITSGRISKMEENRNWRNKTF